jgi:hypothetical protein
VLIEKVKLKTEIKNTKNFNFIDGGKCTSSVGGWGGGNSSPNRMDPRMDAN